MMKCVSSADIQTLRTGLKIKAQPSFSSSFKFNILLMSLKRIAKTKSGYIGNVISISKKKNKHPPGKLLMKREQGKNTYIQYVFRYTPEEL